jgi:DNA-binding LytR/AlgR family response regulator
MKIRCIGIDDHQTSLDLLKDYVSKVDYLQWVGGFNDPIRALNEIDGLQPDLIFLDMQMPGLSGLEFLKTKKPKQPIIIVSDFKDYAFDSYTVSNEHSLVIIDYLAKIILLPRFLQACEKAKMYLINAPKDDDILFLKTEGNKMVQVNINEVSRIEAEGQLMKFFLNDKNNPTFHVRITMGELEMRLQRLRFLRIHDKHLVNANYISLFDAPDSITLTTEKQLNVSKSYQKDIKQFFNSKRLG